MLSAPNKRLFLYIGGLEAVSQLLGFIGASKLPGALAISAGGISSGSHTVCCGCLAVLSVQGCAAGVVLPLLQQSTLLWQVSLAYLVLNKRLSPVQVWLFDELVSLR